MATYSLDVNAVGQSFCCHDIKFGLFTINIVKSVAKIKLKSEIISPTQIVSVENFPEEIKVMSGVERSWKNQSS